MYRESVLPSVYSFVFIETSVDSQQIRDFIVRLLNHSILF